MVIRNYSQPMHVSPAVNSKSSHRRLYEEKRSDAESHPKMAKMTTTSTTTTPPSNRGHATPPKSKGAGVYKQHSTKRTHCNGNGGDCGSDDEVDFRKMNSAIRPGFVANAAKMWDQRAAEQANELNTIVWSAHIHHTPKLQLKLRLARYTSFMFSLIFIEFLFSFITTDLSIS